MAHSDLATAAEIHTYLVDQLNPAEAEDTGPSGSANDPQ
jgi:hypothetical protein